MIKWLAGKKTYLVAMAMVLHAVSGWVLGQEVNWLEVWGALGLSTLRAGIAKSRPRWNRDREWNREMKSGLALVCALGLGTGCATTDQATRAARLQGMVEMAAYSGAAFHLVDHPEDFPRFELAGQTLNLLIRDGQFDVIKFRRALAGLPVRELKGEKGSILIEAGVVFFDALSRETVEVERRAYLKAVMVGMRDGLQRAVRGRLNAKG